MVDTANPWDDSISTAGLILVMLSVRCRLCRRHFAGHDSNSLISPHLLSIGVLTDGLCGVLGVSNCWQGLRVSLFFARYP